MDNHAGGISMIAFVVALGVSMGYYQFVYVPQANAKPVFPKEVLEPPDVTKVTISEGSANEANPKFYVPKEVRATLGRTNLVVWTNQDSIAHTVTTDTDYKDLYSGVFDSQARPSEEGGAFVMPGLTFEFLFTKAGEYAYRCVPHPWMQGSVEVVENFS